MRTLLFLLLLLPSLAAAEERAQSLLQRMTEALRALSAYEIRFAVAGRDGAVEGRIAVKGDRYHIELGDAEVFGSKESRFEIDHRRREVVAAPVGEGSANLLSDPAHAFEFVASQYEASMVGEHGGQALVRLRPAAGSDASMPSKPSMLLAIDTATALPVSVRYELDDDAVDIAIRSVTRSETGPKAFDRKAFEGYEWIDFR